MTLEESVATYEEYALDAKQEKLSETYRYYTQLAEWLRELVERRKAPEIIRCGECKYYKIDHPKANGYHCCYRCHNIFPMKETDFCSKAERRTDAND